MCVSPEAVTEKEYILSHFDETFRSRRNCRIALYPGRYLEDILECFDGTYHFARVLDDQCTEVPEDIDLVILAGYRSQKEPDYKQIHTSCEERGIPLLDLFGFDQIALHRELAEQEYLTIAQWKELLSPYDVISASVSWTVADYNEMLKQWVPRPRFMILYRWMLRMGKTVLFFPEEEGQIPSLEKEIPGFREHLAERTGADRGYLGVRARFPGKKIIHVGLGTVKDGIAPRHYGIDSRIIRYYSFTNAVSASGKDGTCYADRNRLLEEIDRHEIISFDIFDTLIKRTVLHPKDVFGIVEEKTGIRGFADKRYEIQTTCPQFTLEEIYQTLKEQCGYDTRTAEQLKQTELRTETEVILPRRGMAEVFEYAKSRGKTVILVSDMYLDDAFLRELLEKNGIAGYDRMYVSCRFKALKHEGLFETIQNDADGKQILHIGDNPYSDYAAAREFGLDAFCIPGCLELAKKNGYEKALSLCTTLADRKLLGLSVAMGFDDPFRQHADRLIADMVVAPLALGYLLWVCGELAGKRYDWFLLSSRDGRILQDAYSRLQALSEELPPGKYFYTNRHAAFLTVMDDPDLVKSFIDFSVWRSDPGKMLTQLCCLPEEELEPYCGEQPEDYWQMHAAQIHAAAERFRENYRTYMVREGIAGRKCAVMDFVSEGNGQRMLERKVAETMDGFYVGVPEYVSKYAPNIRYYFDQDLMDYNTEMKIEVYYTSSEPALNHIGQGGEPVFDKEIRDGKTMDRIGRIHRLTAEYLNRYLDSLYRPGDAFSWEMVFEMCKGVNNYDAENVYYDDMTGQTIGKEE
ncbi:MAG: hypothetical protein IJJ34_04550 [Clostridia bacterium]|nr:hypothetical protein [Clostridia bacterium]